MKAIGVIPARLNSTRFPRKILASLYGKPMVYRVYKQALKAAQLQDVIVAIDSWETEKALKFYDIKTKMTSEKHKSGTDRVAEVIRDMDIDVVVNIQGDEPMMDPDIIDAMVNEFSDPSIQMVTTVSTAINPDDFINPNAVKVVLSAQGFTIRFFRDIPLNSKMDFYHHIGIYAYRKETLLQLTRLPQGNEEKRLSLEQYRALENGIPIKAIITNFPFRGIDTIDDLKRLQT